jgi:hypothetical protein
MTGHPDKHDPPVLCALSWGHLLFSSRQIMRTPGWLDGSRSSREAIRCLHEELLGEAGSTVVFVFDDVQNGKREMPREAPGHAERGSCGPPW